MGVETTLDQDLLEKSMGREFLRTPDFPAEPSFKQVLQHYAYKAAPLNENAKSFDADRPFFEYSVALNLPEMEKALRAGKTLPFDLKHPYLEMFFEGDIKVDDYLKAGNFRELPKGALERKPLRLEAIIKIQKALGVRLRARPIFPKGDGILEGFLREERGDLKEEELEVLEGELQDLVGLCRDANYFLKKGAMESKLGKKNVRKMPFYEKFVSESKKSNKRLGRPSNESQRRQPRNG